MESSEASRLLELGKCVHAPISGSGGGGSGGGGSWEWTTEGSATSCLTITDTMVKKTSERDGDYHVAHGPELTGGIHSWKIHVGHSSNMTMGLCSGSMINNKHPTSSPNKSWCFIYYAGGTFYTYHNGNQVRQHSLKDWNGDGKNVAFTYNASTQEFTVQVLYRDGTEGPIHECEFSSDHTPAKFYVCLDYTNEWIRLDDYQCRGVAAGGSLDPFESLFASDWAEELKPLTSAASQATSQAKAGLQLGPMFSDPIDSIIGHHSGLMGPALADRVRREAAKKLVKRVRKFTRSRQGEQDLALVMACINQRASDLCASAVKDATSVEVKKKAIKEHGPKHTYKTASSAMLQLMLTMVNKQLSVDVRTTEKVILIIDTALNELEAMSLARASSSKPRSFTPELMDQITEFLAKALHRAQEKPLQMQIANTVSRFASVRGDFRYHAAALVTKRATGIDWLEEEVAKDLEALLGKLVIPHIDDVDVGLVEASLQCSAMLNTLLQTAIVGSTWKSGNSSPMETYHKLAPTQAGWEAQPKLSYSAVLASTKLLRGISRHAIAHARGGGDWFYELKPLCLAASGPCLFDQMVQEVQNLRKKGEKPASKHLTSNGYMYPTAAALGFACTALMGSQREGLSLIQQLEVSVCVYCIMRSAMLAHVWQQVGEPQPLSNFPVGAAAEAEADESSDERLTAEFDQLREFSSGNSVFTCEDMSLWLLNVAGVQTTKEKIQAAFKAAQPTASEMADAEWEMKKSEDLNEHDFKQAFIEAYEPSAEPSSIDAKAYKLVRQREDFGAGETKLWGQLVLTKDWITKCGIQFEFHSANKSSELSQPLLELSQQPVHIWPQDLHTPVGDTGVFKKKKSTTILYPPTGEFAVVDPCNYTFDFVEATLRNVMGAMRQAAQEGAEAFVTASIQMLRVQRLSTLNLAAWQAKKLDKEAAGEPMNDAAIPSKELTQRMFDTARQMLTCLEETTKASAGLDLASVDANAVFLPEMVLKYGQALLEQASGYYYTNATEPSQLLMDTVNSAGVSLTDSSTNQTAISASVGRASVNAMCANINSPVQAARLFSERATTSPLANLDNSEKVLTIVTSFLELLDTDLSSRLNGEQDAKEGMPIIAAVVAQLQMGLWARLSAADHDADKDVSSAHQYAVCYAEKVAGGLEQAAACKNAALLAQSLNRSVFALTLPAFCVLAAKLEWNLSNKLHVECFDRWLAAVIRLASALERLIAVLPEMPKELDAEAELERMKDDPSCSWLDTSLSVLLYNVGKQVLTKHPQEDSNAAPEGDDGDTSSTWLQSPLLIGGPLEVPNKQFESIQALGTQEGELQATHISSMIQSFQPEDCSCLWWDGCVISPKANLPKPISEISLSALEESTTKVVFNVLLRHTGLAAMQPAKATPKQFNVLSCEGSTVSLVQQASEPAAALEQASVQAEVDPEEIPDEILVCFQSAVCFALEIREHYATLEEENVHDHLKGITFRGEFLRTCLEPALQPLAKKAAGLVRAKSGVAPLTRSKTQLGRMGSTGIKSLNMVDLSQQEGLGALALASCIEAVLGFLKDRKVNLVTLTTQLTKRVSRANKRVKRLRSALQLFDQGADSSARRHCTELLLLELTSDMLHFTEGLNGCGRALRKELTKLWHQCLSDVAMPIIDSSGGPVSLKLSALTAISGVWEEHDLAFLHANDVWGKLQRLALSEEMRDDVACKNMLWGLMSQLALSTFCKTAPSEQMDTWQKYVLENMMSVLDIEQNRSRVGKDQMLSLISLCMPTDTEGKNRDLLVQLMYLTAPMVTEMEIDEGGGGDSVPVPPSEILVDQPMSILDGWTKHYDQPYSEGLEGEATQVKPPGDAEWVALGAVENSTGKIVVIGFGKVEEVFRSTSGNETHEHNGAWWYCKHSSAIGFAS
jgi:hypothetical protein